MTTRQLKARTPAELSGMQLLPLRSDGNADLLAVRQPAMTLAEMWLTDAVRDALDTLVLEHQHAKELAKHGLTPAWCALFVGMPGTGKTTAAGALATALELPLVVIGNVIEQWMGASERNIRKVFTRAAEAPGVYLVDEIDGIGSVRGGSGGDDKASTSAGKEYNLTLTSMLSCMDMHRGPGVVIATTNRLDVIDRALRRRFDFELEFPLPDHAQAIALARAILADDGDPELVLGPLAGKSHSDVVRLARAERKRRVLALIVARAAKRAARKPSAPEPASLGTETNDPAPAPEPASLGTSTSSFTPQTSEPAPAPRGTGGQHDRSAPGPAMPGTGTPSRDDQGSLPL